MAADPLRFLHEYAIGERQIKEIIHNNEKYFAFGDQAYKKDTPTNLLVYGKQNEYYTIESLWFLWENRSLAHPAYVRDATASNIKAVTRPDRREILEYLKGERSEIPSNHNASQPPPAPIATNRLVPDGPLEPERKKMKLEPSIAKGQRIDQLLNKDIRGEDKPELRALNDSLTADKIAALKKKRMNHQKRNIASTMDELVMN
uniref:CDC73_N domain-containing protein n=1 Tax=Heterorhabditis bacteriophora TaxID=37862 RepID=A0A1I7X0T8_HETBA